MATHSSVVAWRIPGTGESWQDNTDTAGIEVGDQGTLSSFHRDIGILINFQEESSLVSFWSLELHEPLEVSSDGRGYLVIKPLSAMLEGCFGDIRSVILTWSVLRLRALSSINTHTHTYLHTHTYIPQAKQPWEYRSDCKRNMNETPTTSVSPSVYFSTQPCRNSC